MIVFYPFHGDQNHVSQIFLVSRIFLHVRIVHVYRIGPVSLISRVDYDVNGYAIDWMMKMMSAIAVMLMPNFLLCSLSAVLNGISGKRFVLWNGRANIVLSFLFPVMFFFFFLSNLLLLLRFRLLRLRLRLRLRLLDRRPRDADRLRERL